MALSSISSLPAVFVYIIVAFSTIFPHGYINAVIQRSQKRNIRGDSFAYGTLTIKTTSSVLAVDYVELSFQNVLKYIKQLTITAPGVELHGLGRGRLAGDAQRLAALFFLATIF